MLSKRSNLCLLLAVLACIMLRSEAEASDRLLKRKRAQESANVRKRKGARAKARKGKKEAASSPSKSSKSSGKKQKDSATSEDTICEEGTLLDAINEGESFSVLASAVNLTGIGPILDNAYPPLTAFVPTDEAFAALNELESDFLAPYMVPEYRIHLIEILAFHVTNQGAIFAEDLVDGEQIPTLTLDHEPLTVSIEESGDVFLFTQLAMEDEIQATQIVVADAAVPCNGVAHVVDFPLLPYWISLEVFDVLERQAQFGTLVSLMAAASIDLDMFE